MSKIVVSRIEPTTQISATGKKKYYVYTEDGDRHIAWGEWVEDKKGEELDVTVKQESFKGNDYTTIWPLRESQSVKSRTTLTHPEPEDEPSAGKKFADEANEDISRQKKTEETGGDARNYSIVTQHSQEMSIRLAYTHPELMPQHKTLTERMIFLSLMTRYFRAEADGDKDKMTDILDLISSKSNKEPDENSG